MFRVVTRQLLDRAKYLRLKGQGLAWLEPAPMTFNFWVIEALTASTTTATFPDALHHRYFIYGQGVGGLQCHIE